MATLAGPSGLGQVEVGLGGRETAQAAARAGVVEMDDRTDDRASGVETRAVGAECQVVSREICRIVVGVPAAGRHRWRAAGKSPRRDDDVAGRTDSPLEFVDAVT